MIRVAAGITAVILVFVGLLYLRYSGDHAPEDGTRVVVAARDIAAGTKISEDMVRVVPVLEGEYVIGGSYADTSQVVGKVSKVSLVEGEQIADSKVFAPFENPDIHIDRPVEIRAMALNIEPMASGQRVHPGDRVDILAANDGAGTAMTLVQNVEVLATSRSSATPASPEIREIVTVALDADQLRVMLEWQAKASELLLAFRAVPD